jgi:hypothetical protein
MKIMLIGRGWQIQYLVVEYYHWSEVEGLALSGIRPGLHEDTRHEVERMEHP